MRNWQQQHFCHHNLVDLTQYLEYATSFLGGSNNEAFITVLMFHPRLDHYYDLTGDILRDRNNVDHAAAAHEYRGAVD